MFFIFFLKSDLFKSEAHVFYILFKNSDLFKSEAHVFYIFFKNRGRPTIIFSQNSI